jgi:hypothetical protein
MATPQSLKITQKSNLISAARKATEISAKE